MRLQRSLRIHEAHEDAIWTVAWIPNSPNLISGSVDENVKFWDAAGREDQEPGHTYTGHSLGVVSLTVDSTGEHAASSALDSFIRVWNLKDTSTLAVIETPPSETWQLAFNPTSDELLLAAAGGSGNKVVVWAPEEQVGRQELPLPETEDKSKKDKFVLSVAYSSDGTKLACGCMDGTVAIFDVVTGSLLNTCAGHFKPVRSLAFTPDGQLLLTACDDMHAHMYDVENGALVEAFSGHESWVLTVAARPTGDVFATGSSDSMVKLWDIHTRTCVQTMKEHGDQVWGVAWQSDGGRLCSVSDDKNIVTYNAEG
eukprot:jgi/Botrbrau1/3985/Bobra.0365s0057.1